MCRDVHMDVVGCSLCSDIWRLGRKHLCGGSLVALKVSDPTWLYGRRQRLHELHLSWTWYGMNWKCHSQTFVLNAWFPSCVWCFEGYGAFRRWAWLQWVPTGGPLIIIPASGTSLAFFYIPSDKMWEVPAIEYLSALWTHSAFPAW